MDLKDLEIFYFDSIGVPPFEDMVKEYGSADEWQRVKTHEWVQKMSEVSAKDVILDAQARPSFIEEACKERGINNYEIILFDCSDEKRKERLIGRGQPELADERMMNWAKHIREGCGNGVCKIIDNTELSLEETTKSLLALLGKA